MVYVGMAGRRRHVVHTPVAAAAAVAPDPAHQQLPPNTVSAARTSVHAAKGPLADQGLQHGAALAHAAGLLQAAPCLLDELCRQQQGQEGAAAGGSGQPWQAKNVIVRGRAESACAVRALQAGHRKAAKAASGARRRLPCVARLVLALAAVSLLQLVAEPAVV